MTNDDDKSTDPAVREETLTTIERIRVAMAEKGWTQKQLAAAANVSPGNLSRYLKGTVAPGADVVDRLIKALGATHTLAAVDGALGIQQRADGKLIPIDIMAEPMPIDWIAELPDQATGFVARGFLTMISGEAGAGKSMTTQTLAEALVTGKERAFGFKLNHRYVGVKWAPGTCPSGDKCAEHDTEHEHEQIDTRVLVLDAENAANVVQDRAQKMGLTGDEAPRYMAFASDGFDFYRDRKVLDQTLQTAKEAGAPVDLLVLDSFTSLWMGNENVVDQVMPVLKYLNATAARFNLGILLIHHTDKEGEKERGSSAINATIGGGAFLFTRYDDKEGEDITARRLSCRKMRIAPEPLPHRVYLTSRGIAAEPETTADRVAFSVAERDRRRRGETDDRPTCNCPHPVHGGAPCQQLAADDTGRCLRCFQESH